MPVPARIYIGLVATAGGILLAFQLSRWQCADPLRFGCYFLLALAACGLKVPLPGLPGTMSVTYAIVLVGVAELSLPETLAIGCTATLLQLFWRAPRRPPPAQLVFNPASFALAAWGAYGALGLWPGGPAGNSFAPAVASAACAYFLISTASIAVVIALTGGGAAWRVWRNCYFWSFPYYLAGAGLAALVILANRQLSWQFSLFGLPLLYVLYRSYRLYLGRLAGEKEQAEQTARLHLRTIEALALAIEAKDENTRGHLRRVKTYAVALGRGLGLSGQDLLALEAAAILHDIGQLAVPEHILSKPGKLTPEEFERMKIHPLVGAEILERVEFPYPVAPIVRAHHERWDGGGYPDKLAGEAIPLGARILAAVDCLDALASDRQYRRALPLDGAMEAVAAEAGKAFDPRVVAQLQLRYQDLERTVAAQMAPENGRPPRAVRGEPSTPAGATGERARVGEGGRSDFLSSIAAARQEGQMLYELTQALGSSLSLHETLSVLDSRLQRLVPYDAIAVYVRREHLLAPEYVNGDNARLFAALEIPVGQGLSGWVAETGSPVLNGNPSVEAGYLNDPSRFSTLRSAIAVPLEASAGVMGVLALYHAGPDAYRRDHLRILQSIVPKVSLSIENALQYRQAQSASSTEGATGLPNARALFLHLDAELARSRRGGGSRLAVVVCDVEGLAEVHRRFGQMTAARALRAVGAALREICREYDFVAHMGGHEFVLVLPGLLAADLAAKAAHLNQIVGWVGRQECGGLLSAATGAAFYPEQGADAEQLLAEADRALFESRRLPKPASGGAAPAAGLAAGLLQ